LFKRSYSKLAKEEQALIDRAIRTFAKHPHYPFAKELAVHKLKGVFGAPRTKGEKAPPVWEMHANGPLIITFQYGQDEVVFRNCGEHESVLRSP
jgi:hypothetical protein